MLGSALPLALDIACAAQVTGEISQNEGYLFGVPIIGIIVFWVLYWVPLILGNYQEIVRRVAKPAEKGPAKRDDAEWNQV